MEPAVSCRVFIYRKVEGGDEAQEPRETRRLEVSFNVPTRTIVKLLVTATIVWAMLRLWPEFVLLMIAVVMALALRPIVDWFERKGLGRSIAILVIALGLVATMIGFLVLVTTSLAEQLSRLVKDFPTFHARIEHRLPGQFPVLKRIVDEIFALPSSPELAKHLERPLALGTSVLGGALSMFFTMIMTLYLVLDGKRLYAWLIAYVPRKHRDRMAVTADEVSVVVQAYVLGQVITSALFTAYVAIILTVFKVPAALPLALVAGFCDVIPVVGIIIATAPAAILAFTVSPTVGFIVTGLYALYHAVESYYIVPRVYGSRLRLSTLAVLIALTVGSALQGLIGAILVLPLVAAYPIIERIWLSRYLSPEVIKDHGALAGSIASDNKEQVVDTVLQGERHPWEGPTGATSPLWKPMANAEAGRSRKG